MTAGMITAAHAPTSTRWPLWAQYLLSAAAVGLALGVRWWLDPLLGDSVPFITVFAVLLMLLLSVREGPFLVASALAGLGVALLFIAPRFTLSLAGARESTQLLLFGVAMGAAAGWRRMLEGFLSRRRQADEELTRRNEELRLVVDAVPALISYVDADLRYQFVNAHYAQWLGCPREQFIGQDIRQVLGESAFARLRPAIDDALRGRRAHFEGELPFATGQRRVRAEYVPDIRADGSVAGFYALITDGSERQQAQAAQARLAAIVETSGDAIMSISPDATILTWNAGAERLFGYTAAEAVGRTVNLILPPECADDEQSIRERVQRGELIGPYDTLRRAKDGRLIDVSVTVSPIRDESGRIIGASKLDRDITERKQAELALRESQRQLATLVDNLPGVAYRYRNEPGWPVDFISDRVCDIVGHDADEFSAGKVSWTQLIHRDEVDEVRAKVEASVRARTPWQIEYRVRHREGFERWVLERGEPVVDSEGRLLALEGLITDITQRKHTEHELETARARERSYLEHLPVGVWFVNEKGEVTFSNAAGRRIWGGAPFVGAHQYVTFEAYWHGTDRRLSSEDWALARALRSGETSIGEELDIVALDGNRKTITSSAVPVRDGDGTIIGAVVMNLDITEQKRAEAALKYADRRKDEFLATLAHELRNPLAAIRTATELLLAGRDNAAQLERVTAIIKRQVALMVRLMDDLLEVSRITHGNLELRMSRTSLRGLIEQALDTAHPWIERKGHRVLLEASADSIEIEGDPVRLVQVFTNVLSNACKYTDPGGRIEIHVAREGDTAVIEFRDNGVGIPRDKLDSIFEMFAQLDAPGRGAWGLGIGLTLARQLVEMHGGEMSAKSEGPGRGSQFTIRIPALPRAQPRQGPVDPATEVEAPQASGQGRRVLVVDDNVDAADTLALLLSARGHATRTAYDGTSALTEVAQFRPEVLLLDLGLPDINGAEVCKAIRAEPWGQGILVVALSGWGQERDKQRTAEAGFDAHLTKPANLGELTSLLERAPASELS